MVKNKAESQSGGGNGSAGANKQAAPPTPTVKSAATALDGAGSVESSYVAKYTLLADRIAEIEKHHNENTERFTAAEIKKIESHDVKAECAVAIAEIKEQLALLTERQKQLEQSFEKQEVRIDNMEQNQRFSSLILHGLAEVDREHPFALREIICKIAADKLKMNISPYDISDAYRIGKPGQQRHNKDGKVQPRPVNIQFLHCLTRRDAWGSKKGLAKSGLLLTESLTMRRLQLLRLARERAGVRGAWSNNGTIFIIEKDGSTKKVITTVNELDKIYPPNNN